VDALNELAEKDRALAQRLVAEIVSTNDGSLSVGFHRDVKRLFPELYPDKAIPEVSVVLPVYNEEDNIRELYRRLKPVVESVGSYEVILVDDGSSDGSAEILREVHELDAQFKVIRFSRNFGHQAAISAGIDRSRGNAVILMDSDLQDPPELLPDILELWRAGAEVVYAVRRQRKENFVKRVCYFAFYRLLQFVSNIDIPLDSGDFCLLDRKVVDHLKSMPERNRFLRGLRSWIGFRQVPFYYERDARFAGDVKYTFRKLLGLALNGIISFSSLPLRLATYFGFLTFFLGILYIVYAVAAYLIYHASPQGWTSLTVLFLLVGGVQLILLGAIGEYIGRMYDEVKQRPNYIIQEFYD
jgi:dolichol-phosphate mannosyltransferase